ncbi:MAG: hypothetical protein Kow00124_09140 [Anaerolineae bacterium]
MSENTSVSATKREADGARDQGLITISKAIITPAPMLISAPHNALAQRPLWLIYNTIRPVRLITVETNAPIEPVANIPADIHRLNSNRRLTGQLVAHSTKKLMDR